MPTDYGVTSTKFGYVTLRKDVMCPRRFEKKSCYVPQRHHMPMSIFKKIVTLRNLQHLLFSSLLYLRVRSVLEGFHDLEKGAARFGCQLVVTNFC